MYIIINLIVKNLHFFQNIQKFSIYKYVHNNKFNCQIKIII